MCLAEVSLFEPLGPRELTGAVDLINHYKLVAHHEFFCKRSLPLSISDTHYLHNVVGDTEIRKGDGMQLDQLIQNTSYSRDTNVRIQPFDLDVLREAFQLRETAPIDLPPVRNLPPWCLFLCFVLIQLLLWFCFDSVAHASLLVCLVSLVPKLISPCNIFPPLFAICFKMFLPAMGEVIVHLFGVVQAEKGIPTIAGKSKSESKDKERKHKKHKDRDKEKDKEHKKHKHRHNRSKEKDKEKKDRSGQHDSAADHSKKHHEKVCRLLTSCRCFALLPCLICFKNTKFFMILI